MVSVGSGIVRALLIYDLRPWRAVEAHGIWKLKKIIRNSNSGLRRSSIFKYLIYHLNQDAFRVKGTKRQSGSMAPLRKCRWRVNLIQSLGRLVNSLH